ncbi:MAG: FAD:protein FMN transferase [Acidimicrobiales bacterium]
MSATTVRVHEFRAMGSRCQVVVDGPLGLTDRAEARVRALEETWSRFVADSEISRINERPGRPVTVGSATIDLFRRAEFARVSTGGLFDPMVLDHLIAAGYDRDHRELVPAQGTAQPRTGAARPVGTFRVDGDTVTVEGGRFDPGGLGKGLAADLVAEELLEVGAAGCYLDLGGDIRFAGEPIDGERWRVHVDDPLGVAPVCTLGLPPGGGGVATSGVLTRRWHHDGADRHHLIDPRTGEPADTALASVTVIAGATWWAEVMAKSALVAGADDAESLLHEGGVTAILVAKNGKRTVVGDLEEVGGS